MHLFYVPNYVSIMIVLLSRARLVFLRSGRLLLVAPSVVPSSPTLVTLMKEVLSSSETSVITRATLRNIPEDAILHSHRREYLISYEKGKVIPVTGHGGR
jgi:hypothetical protein